MRQKGLLFITRESKRLKKSLQLKPAQLTEWNNFWVLSSVPAQIILGDKDKNLPIAVRQSIPAAGQDFMLNFVSGTQKELEKKFNFDYKKKKHEVILLSFKGKK